MAHIGSYNTNRSKVAYQKNIGHINSWECIYDPEIYRLVQLCHKCLGDPK